MNGQQLKLIGQTVAGAPGLPVSRISRDYDISKQLGVEVSEFSLGHAERKHIGRRIDFSITPIKFANARVIDNEHANFGVGPLFSLERCLNRLANWREPYFRSSYRLSYPYFQIFP